MSRVVFSFLVCAFFSTLVEAKYLKLPWECHYMYGNRGSHYNKKDLKCFVKMQAVDVNSKTPLKEKYSEIYDVKPSGNTIIYKHRITNYREFRKNRKEMKDYYIGRICRRDVIKEYFVVGLKMTHIYYYKGKVNYRFNVSNKICKKARKFSFFGYTI